MKSRKFCGQLRIIITFFFVMRSPGLYPWDVATPVFLISFRMNYPLLTLNYGGLFTWDLVQNQDHVKVNPMCKSAVSDLLAHPCFSIPLTDKVHSEQNPLPLFVSDKTGCPSLLIGRWFLAGSDSTVRRDVHVKSSDFSPPISLLRSCCG